MTVKEVRLSPVIDKGDFDTELRNARKFPLKKEISEGASICFKGHDLPTKRLALVLADFAEATQDGDHRTTC